MSERADLSGVEGQATALPAANILNYVTSAGTPTRVRRVAAIGARIMALMYFGLTLYFGWLYYGSILREIMRRRMWAIGFVGGGPVFPGPAPLTWTMVLDAVWRTSPLLAGVVIVACISCVLWFCALRVERGSSWACTVCSIVLLPLMIALALLTTAIGIVAVGMGLGLSGIGFHPVALLAFIPLVLGVLSILMLKDLHAYLKWITVNPITEKPPVPFLPGAASEGIPSECVGPEGYTEPGDAL